MNARISYTKDAVGVYMAMELRRKKVSEILYTLEHQPHAHVPLRIVSMNHYSVPILKTQAVRAKKETSEIPEDLYHQ